MHSMRRDCAGAAAPAGSAIAGNPSRYLNLASSMVCVMVLLFLFPAASAARAGQVVGRSLASNVDPFIGTGKGPGGNENLYPGAVVPFGMVQLSPDTESHGYGYHYYQHDIQGFSMTHMSGPGGPNEGEVFFTATTGSVETATPEFESPYSHQRESAVPGYYWVLLSRWGIKAELTATDRTGLVRFTFPAGKAANILVPISQTLNQTVAASIRVEGSHKITGYVVNRIWGSATYKVYFVMVFNRPFSSFGAWKGNKPGGPGKIFVGGRSAKQTRLRQWVGAYVRWPASAHSQTVVAKVGISYVDLAGAENNLKTETAGKSFKQVRRDARSAWNQALGVIEVAGGTARSRRVFYTALYHSFLMPSTYSDADGRYTGFASTKVYRVAPGHRVYCNFSGWDIYRSEMPLLALVEPNRAEDMSRSIVLMYKQGGWIGRWPFINRYTNDMAGSPLTVVLCMDWLDGLHGFDINSAWEGMLRDVTEAPPPGHRYRGEPGIEWINKLHYVPNDQVQHGSVSQIQEDCIAYASLYDLAVKLHKTQAAKRLYRRALYYRNVFNHQDRYFHPRNSDGKWVPGFSPACPPGERPGSGFIEGSGWHYQWLAPSDLAWLVHAVGVKLFNQRLTAFFNYPKPGYDARYYNPYDETDLEAPFEFNFSGESWKSQRVVRRVLRENYTTAPGGIPGNDDCGEMSSWAVMSMMGIYTVDPASLAYELVSPVFSKIVIHLHAPYQGKAFTIAASSDPEHKPYIQGVKLDGRIHAENWIDYHRITAGGKLEIVLGPRPNKSWGSKPEDVPPSLSRRAPATSP